MNSKGSFYKQLSKYTKVKPAPVPGFQHWAQAQQIQPSADFKSDPEEILLAVSQLN